MQAGRATRGWAATPPTNHKMLWFRHFTRHIKSAFTHYIK